MIAFGELNDWLRGTAADAALIILLEKRAVEFVQNVTNRHFGASQAFTEILPGTGDNTLWLNELPSALTSVEDRMGVGDSWVAIATGDSDGWELLTPRVRRNRGFVWRFDREYRVIYSFGYAANAEPEMIRQLVLDLTKLKYDERCSNLAIASERLGDEAYARDAFTADIRNIPWVRETLGEYTWPRLA